jgi:hypothetical protein
MAQDSTEAARDDALERRWGDLNQTIEAKRQLLVQQGSVVRKLSKDRWYACLRYREPDETGRLVQRSIYLGTDPELVRRVEARLQGLRASRQELTELLGLVRLARALVATARRL